MSGVVKPKEGEAWIAASWVFDNIMQRARKYVGEDFSKLHSLMDEAENSPRYIQLSELSPVERAVFRQALDEAYADAEKAGSKSFASHEFYLGFIERFRELLDLIDENS